MSKHTCTLTEVKTCSATCTEPGVKTAYWKCTGEGGCGKCFTAETGGSEISTEQLAASYIEAALGHNFTGTARDNENGTHSFKCSRCDVYGYNGKVYLADVEGSELCSGGTATCAAKAVCEKCGGSYGDTAFHFFTGDAVSNNNGTHSFKCVNEGCTAVGTMVNKGFPIEHGFEDCADNDADHKCDKCGYVMSQCKDENGDDKCDICGKDMGKPITPVKPACNPIVTIAKAVVKTVVAVKTVTAVKTAAAVTVAAKVVKSILKWF